MSKLKVDQISKATGASPATFTLPAALAFAAVVTVNWPNRYHQPVPPVGNVKTPLEYPIPVPKFAYPFVSHTARVPTLSPIGVASPVKSAVSRH